uniref:EF-hand domain-containing protein n=1 Tax=Castor canadensis TaxID=51338 RepID=A0A8C0ZUN4_CASCN
MQFPMGPACISLRRGIAKKQRVRGDDAVQELWASFLEFDKDCDGLISYKDLGNIMRTMGYMPTEMELTELGQLYGVPLITSLLPSMVCHVDFEDFVELMTPNLLAETAGMIGIQKIPDAFREEISVYSLYNSLSQLCIKIDRCIVQEIFMSPWKYSVQNSSPWPPLATEPLIFASVPLELNFLNSISVDLNSVFYQFPLIFN